MYRSGQAEAFARQVRAVADQALGLFSPSYEETLERWSSWQEIAREEGGWAEEEEDVFIRHAQLVFDLGQYHPKRTSYGTRVPYLKKDGRTFGFLKLDALPPSCPAGEYWPRLGANSLRIVRHKNVQIDKAELSAAFLFSADTSRSDSDLLTQPSMRSFIR